MTKASKLAPERLSTNGLCIGGLVMAGVGASGSSLVLVSSRKGPWRGLGRPTLLASSVNGSGAGYAPTDNTNPAKRLVHGRTVVTAPQTENDSFLHHLRHPAACMMSAFEQPTSSAE